MNAKNNHDKPRFNIADIIIIIAIIAVISALALRIYNIFGTEDNVEKVTISFEVEGIDAEKITLKKGEKLYSADDDSLVGTLDTFEISNTLAYAYNENGELVKATVPGKKTITGTITMQCTKTTHGYYLGGTRLLSEGEKITLYTTTREMEFTIKKIAYESEPAPSACLPAQSSALLKAGNEK